MSFCIALGELLVRYAYFERGFAYLIVAFTAIVLGGILVAIAIPRVKKSVAMLQDSKDEFFTNLRSLSAVWTQDLRAGEVRRRATAEHNGKH